MRKIAKVPGAIGMFRAYSAWGGRSPYWHVYLWPSLKAMRGDIRRKIGGSGISRAIAAHLEFVPTHSKTKQLVGEMHFAARYLCAGTVTHECGHAAHALARRRGRLRDEEELCGVMGRLADQIAIIAIAAERKLGNKAWSK